jgi:alkylhydroperoxidase family enzyme
MTDRPISRFPVPDMADMPDDIRTRILGVQEKAGFVPNVFLALAHRPDEFRAFFAYHDALMERDGGLTKTEREMIVVATSGANQCQYCVVAQRAMLDFAMKVSRSAETVDEADFAALAEHGFEREDIWDIGAIAAFFALSNRFANLVSLRPNDEFYLMGRVAKG